MVYACLDRYPRRPHRYREAEHRTTQALRRACGAVLRLLRQIREIVLWYKMLPFASLEAFVLLYRALRQHTPSRALYPTRSPLDRISQSITTHYHREDPDGR